MNKKKTKLTEVINVLHDTLKKELSVSETHLRLHTELCFEDAQTLYFELSIILKNQIK